MRTSNTYIVTNANAATAHMAYKTNEVCAIYPITPSSEMSELVEEWSADHKENIFGGVPSVFEMQSEAGVAGALHGSLQTGSLATTFTASQGLLLMMPNMFKIAGELTPNVIHVATRTVATHALSIFSDHSDIMAVRNTGYAFLGGASVQEAQDFTLIAQAATLESRIPFVHFFDGFRTSHETAKIIEISDAVIKSMINTDLVLAHGQRALNPNKPVIRGTSQGPETYFQSREAVNPFYEACPTIVQAQMDKFAELTGRAYQLFEYVGHKEAEHIVIAMASATETIAETVKYLNAQGEKVGVVKVRLFRPFSTEHLLRAIPRSCKTIGVLDRTKEPGATGEPLYLDVLQTLMASQNEFEKLPTVVGGRYGLSSKELEPNMVKAVFDNLKSSNPKNNFTVGITDDVTRLSLPFSNHIQLKNSTFEILVYETKSNDTMASIDAMTHLLGENHFVQRYTDIDYKKSGSRAVSNLRLGESPINAPYLISNADLVACDSPNFLENDNVVERLQKGAVLLVKTALAPYEFWKSVSKEKQDGIRTKNIQLFTVNGNALSNRYVVDNKAISGLHACVLAFQEEGDVAESLSPILEFLNRVDTDRNENATGTPLEIDADFAESLLGKLMLGMGNELPVSAFPVDGTYETDTTKFYLRNTERDLPQWNMDACIQCGACSMACPQGAIRTKVYGDDCLQKAPKSFQAAKALEEDWQMDLLNYTVQVNPEQCTSCNHCVDACPAKALVMKSRSERLPIEKTNWGYFEQIPEFDRTKIDTNKVSQQQLQEPLFHYSVGDDGCGEAPYLKLLSQLFGDRMLLANATGASSIFGGALPYIPWAKNKAGRGPAWSNSLFEDNAEFGLGFRLSLDQKEATAKKLLHGFKGVLDATLIDTIQKAPQENEIQIIEQRKRVADLKEALAQLKTEPAKRLIELADALVKQSVWIVGGDGWAYDIGYGGLDHVIASGKNVNILVLDNEVYSNTGGQMSKATPFGASAKFAANGKQRPKKDLGRLAMTYDDVYVASISIGADQEHTLKAFQEAESFDGPSLIIAYCHSPAHGIDVNHPSQYHQAAVASGHWKLYRHDPRNAQKGLKAFQLDFKEPYLPIETYHKMEKRFSKALEQDQGKDSSQNTMPEPFIHRLERAEKPVCEPLINSSWNI